MNKVLSIFSASLVLFLFSCGGGSDIYDVFGCTDSTALNYDSLATDDDGSCIYDTYRFEGDWSFSPNCEEYILGVDTIFLADELPDTISIYSSDDNILSLDVGVNTLNATLQNANDFYIQYESFRAYLDLGIISDTATIYLMGDGNFSSDSSATMNLTFSEPNLPGQIDCTVSLSKLNW